MVVSEVGALRQAPYGLADYYDDLARNAFGNFRDLMEEVTLHPAMGVYLSMLGNQKPDPERSISPDENYAREFMQLFTIGLVELNMDGTTRLDAAGQPIPIYDQDIVEGFAHVFTGWSYANGANFLRARRTADSQTLPMQLYPNYHATGAKQLLNGVRPARGPVGEPGPGGRAGQPVRAFQRRVLHCYSADPATGNQQPLPRLRLARGRRLQQQRQR